MAKKRTKKYRPRDVRAPMLIRTLLKGEKMTSVELAMINRIVTGSLDLVQLMTFHADEGVRIRVQEPIFLIFTD